jgi:hypothetical protein
MNYSLAFSDTRRNAFEDEIILTFGLIHMESGYLLSFICWPPPNLPQRERNMPEKRVSVFPNISFV